MHTLLQLTNRWLGKQISDGKYPETLYTLEGLTLRISERAISHTVCSF